MNQRIDGQWGGGERSTGTETLVERGRQLHSRAVFDACARLLQPLKGLSTRKSESVDGRRVRVA